MGEQHTVANRDHMRSASLYASLYLLSATASASPVMAAEASPLDPGAELARCLASNADLLSRAPDPAHDVADAVMAACDKHLRGLKMQMIARGAEPSRIELDMAEAKRISAGQALLYVIQRRAAAAP